MHETNLATRAQRAMQLDATSTSARFHKVTWRGPYSVHVFLGLVQGASSLTAVFKELASSLTTAVGFLAAGGGGGGTEGVECCQTGTADRLRVTRLASFF